MTFDRGFKCFVLFALPLFMIWLGFIDETTFGLEPEDLRGFATAKFIFLFLLGGPFCLIFIYLPYVLITTGVIALWLWTSRGRTWTTRTALFACAGAVTALALMTGVGSPVGLGAAAVSLVVLVARITGSGKDHWVDSFAKYEGLTFTLVAIWLLSAVNWPPGYGLGRTESGTDAVLPYTTRYSREMDNRAKKAVSRFSDPQACLVIQPDESKQSGFYALNWSSIRTTAQAEVCMFRRLTWGPSFRKPRWCATRDLVLVR